MVQGNWVGDPLPFSLFVFFFVTVLLFIPLECINCPGWGWVFRSLCLDPVLFSLLSCFTFSLSLAYMHADPVVAGFGYLNNEQ